MDSGLKQRLVGAAVLVALAVIFLPMLVQGPAPDSGVSDVRLTMPDAPDDQFETRDLPLVTPGATPEGGAVGLDPKAVDDERLPTVDTANATSASQPVALGDNAPLEDNFVSSPKPLPLEPSVPTPVVKQAQRTMLPAATAGGDYAVHFGAYATSSDAAVILRQLRGSQLIGYSERTTLNGKTAYRVRIGPYATRAQAEAVRLRAAQVRDDVAVRVVALDAGAAPPPKPAAVVSATTAPVKASAQTARTASTPAATNPAEDGFAVQVGAFTRAADATALRDRLRATGFAAFIESVDTDKGTLTRVRVGPVLTRVEADQLKAQVSSKAGIDGIVRSYP